MGKQLRQIEQVTIRCCICLNQNKDVAAFSVINGYACCEAHIELVSRPGFDIFSFYGGGKTRAPAQP